MHKQTLNSHGKVHWKIFYEDKANGTVIQEDVTAEKLVAKTFLETVCGKYRIYHIDGDLSNSKYNNLMYVDDKEFYKLSVQQMHVNELGRVQAYVPFLNQNRMKARRLWNDMQTRCYNAKYHKRSPEYEECSICQEWLEDKEKFFQWVEENYYTVGDERMDLDKDILVKGIKYIVQIPVYLFRTVSIHYFCHAKEREENIQSACIMILIRKNIVRM